METALPTFTLLGLRPSRRPPAFVVPHTTVVRFFESQVMGFLERKTIILRLSEMFQAWCNLSTSNRQNKKSKTNIFFSKSTHGIL